ncbi:MAG: FapA family protein [Desulfamplus sp.]
MADKKSEKILVVEGEQSMGDRIERLLTRAGYEVRLVNSSYPAIAALEASTASPFALVISAYRIPGMNGDDLLEHARSIAPDTQRMLFAEASDAEILLNAINRAAIHSSIAVPFKDELFISEVARRCNHFKQIQKRGSLKKLTEHQNQQMYKIALSLKKKQEQFKQQIEEKQSIINNLLSKEPYINKIESETAVNLKKNSIFAECRRAAREIKIFFEHTAFDNKSKIKQIDDKRLAELINNSYPTIKDHYTQNYDMPPPCDMAEDYKELIDIIVTLFFQNQISKINNQFQYNELDAAKEILFQNNMLVSNAPTTPPVDSDAKAAAAKVFPELTIKGDLNYETGDIKFNGNVTVHGVVKSGCSVNCVNLKAQAVEGGKIYLTGDLHLSLGIIDADVVNVQGSVNARYIRSSRIKALGDIVVQKEIIDSELFIGGRCVNENGRITSSFINARRGVSACKIGTEKSSPSKFEVGTEGIIEMMNADLDERVQIKSDELKSIKDDILSFESEEKMLHGKISDAVYIQDNAQLKLRGIEKQLPKIEASEDIMEVQQTIKMVNELHDQIESAETVINKAFERQDIIVEQTLIRQRKIDEIDKEISEIRLKQRTLREFAVKNRPKAELIVKEQIMAGTVIAGTKSRILLKKDLSGCRIYEAPAGDRAGGYEMVVVDVL